MSEFEELRLTVNLVDNASSGLQRMRSELGQLTQATDAMATSLNTGAAGVTALGTTSTNAAPQVRTLNQHMREASRSAADLKDGFLRMGVATQGLSSLPQLVGGVRDMGIAVHGLSSAFSIVGSAARIAVAGIGVVAIGVAAVGAAVVAYGVSVFKFAREMDTLSKSAKTMGLSFAELKYAQDQAKRFGQSAESVTRSYQGIQAAQLDLYKNNSQLRAKLLAQGVDAGWITQLQTLDPNSSRNAIIRYGKALEAQALASGAGANVAAALKNDWLGQFGVDKDAEELPPPSPESVAKLKEIGKLSRAISDVWNQIVHQWTLFSSDTLSANMPTLLKAMERLKANMPKILDVLKVELKKVIDQLPALLKAMPRIIRRVGAEMKGVLRLFSTAFSVLRFLKNPWKETKRSLRESRDQEHPALKGFFGGEVTDEYRRKYRELQDREGGYSIWDKEFWGGGKPSDQFLRNKGLKPVGKPTSYQSGANDNTGELIGQTDRNATQTEKLTGQLEKLNSYFDRMKTQQDTRQNRTGIMNASFTSGGGFDGGGFEGGGGNAAGGAGIPSGGYRGETGSPSSGGTRDGGGGSAGTAPAETSDQAVSNAQGTGAAAFLARKRAGFKKELAENPETRKLLGAILSAENPGAGPAVVESLMNRTELVNESRAKRGLPPKSLREMIIGNNGKSFYGPIRSGAINEHLAKMNNPAYAAQMNRQINAALGGSNTIESYTDQGSKGDPNYVAGGIGVNINKERFNDWGYAGSVAWRQKRQRELAAANTTAEEPSATVAANSNVPELSNSNPASRPGPTVERAALQRNALTSDKASVETDGSLKASIEAPAGTKVEVSGSGAFKKTETERSTAVGQ